MANERWPLFDLQVRTDEVTLRYPNDDELMELVDLSARGVHDDELMPFSVPWTRLAPPALQRSALQYHWRCRAEVSPSSFTTDLVVVVDGRIVGSSGIIAKDFPTLRQFETGSWLGREFQGRGIGTAMRRASLALGFEGFGAVRALTGAWADNPASIGVTRKLGYAEQGHRWADREGTATKMLGFEMERDQYERIRPPGLEFVGLQAVRAFLDIDPSGGSDADPDTPGVDPAGPAAR